MSFIAKDLIWNLKSDTKEVAATWREGSWRDVENNELLLFGYTKNYGASSIDFYLLKMS